MRLRNHFWGDLYGQVKDRFGHNWALGQEIEDIASEVMERHAGSWIQPKAQDVREHMSMVQKRM